MASPGSIVIQAVVDSAKAARDAGKLALSLGKVDSEADTLDGSLRDAEQAIDRLGSEAATAGGDLGRAETALDQVGDEADLVADELRRAGQQMSDSIRAGAQGVEREADTMRGNLGELGRESGAEFVGNIAEGIGSGQANLTDVVSGTLGGLTNLAATLTGPVGIAAGAAAAGIGILFSKVKEDADKARERVNTLAGALEDLGTTSGKAAQQAIWETWLTTMKESPDELARIVDGLAAAGIESATWKAAITGNVEAQGQVKDRLKEIGDQIADNVRKGKPLTEDQQTYLENQGRIHEQLRNMNGDLETVEDRQQDINWLQGKASGQAKEWAEATGLVRSEAQRTKDILDALDGKDVRVDFVANYTGRESDWNPAARAGAQSTTVGTRAAPVNVTINMQGAFNDPLGNAREIKRLLEMGDLRNGRTRGQPLAVAWG